MINMLKHFDDYHFVIAAAPAQDIEFYKQFIPEDVLKNDQLSIVEGKTYPLLQRARAALVTSGTATLETALFDVPQVVCYESSKVSYEIAKRLVKIKYISLVNLIADKKIVTELIQDELNEGNIKTELALILEGKGRTKMLAAYSELKNTMGNSGASDKTAKKILEMLH